MPAVTPVRTFAVKGWPGGLNLENYEHLRNGDEADICDFALGPRGEAVSRAGLDLLAEHDSWSGGPPATYGRLAALFPFTPDAGTTKYLIAVDVNGKVWRTGAGPAGPLVACNVTGPAQINLGAPPVVPAGATLGGYFILVCEDDDPHYWDGTAELWTAVSDHSFDSPPGGRSGSWEMPVCSTVCSGWSRLWAAGNDTYPSRLYWSGALGTLIEGSEEAAGPWCWDADNWVDINPEDGGEITRIVPFGQAIIVFKNNSIYALVGAGDPTTARLYPIHLNIGCTLPGTVAESTGRLFWATDDGVYTYDGSGVTRIDQKVRSYLAAAANLTYAKYASGYAVGERYHLHLPLDLNGDEGRHMVYDTETNTWELHTDGGWGTALFSDQAYVTRWGGVFTAGGNSAYDDVYSAAGAMTSTLIPAYLKTAWLPPPDQRTLAQYRLRRLDLYLERPAVSASYPCLWRVSVYADYNETSRVVGYLLDLDSLEKDAEAFTVTLPGYAGLLDAFQIVFEPVATTGETGNERVGLNGLACLLSERPAHAGPSAVLPEAVSMVP